MKIHSAEFIKSSPSLEDCPKSKLPEYAFIGRSNVGKSSLINRLVNRKDLAKTSQQPGKTQLINHFLINEAWHVVDLPGYGFAKVSKTQREAWGKMIKDFLLGRETLVGIFVLIDARIEAQALDLNFMRFLGESGIPFVMVFTKTDKVKKGLDKKIEDYKKIMLAEWEEMPKYFLSSAESGRGIDEILSFIADVNKTTE